MSSINMDSFLNKVVDNYVILKHLGSGAVGHMFLCRNAEMDDNRAIKFMPYDSLRKGWENEIRKVNQLRGQDKVVRFISNGSICIDDANYAYIVWEYIENDSLRKLIETSQLTMAILIDVIRTVLEVLHACQVASIVHADLHAGNILVQKENPFNIDSTYRKIWVTDFGYVVQDDGREYLDDYQGLNRLIKEALRSISFNSLDSENKRVYRYLDREFERCLLETNPIEDEAVRNPIALLTRLNNNLSNTTQHIISYHGGIGDYLAAEHLGDNFEEWKAIFVPKFIAINELLERNICVLTGLRGCGKTMLFKRLSSYFNTMIGEYADIEGSDSFFGFYLNARDIAEAFPWLPDDMEDNARNQLIHNFHLNWCLEILNWLREYSKRNGSNLLFLNRYFKNYYPHLFTSGIDQNIHYLVDLIHNEIGRSRLGSAYKDEPWPLTNYDFLDEFVEEIKRNLSLPNNMPFYFFLDDYSLPMVKATTQRILNPIIFRRSADVIFKVATESVESFVPTGLNKKVLEENDDYRLIDCGTIALTQKSDNENKDILFSILQPRIERHPILKGRNLNIENILGKTYYNDEERARLIRGEEVNMSDKNNNINPKYLYQGWNVFAHMWSSDIREMIDLFAAMVSKENDEILAKQENKLISDSIQDEVYKESGGQFMSLLAAATNPAARSLDTDNEHEYAKHLIKIVKAFQEIATYALNNQNSKNQSSMTVKKARRIEITNVDGELTGKAKEYYQGLIRYGIFIQDYRGKSVRGKLVPRLYLRSRLIPYFRLTFSKRDSITMSWDDFTSLLTTPEEMVKRYVAKTKNDELPTGAEQMSIWGGEIYD